MDKNRIITLKTSFDGVVNAVPEVNVEYWLARDLMPLLGYQRWENFYEAIQRAENSCKTQDIDVSLHFRDVTKMINLPKGAKREIADVMLSRYACYLIAMNGDPRKEEIAFAQGYFAVQTRKQELIEERIQYIERMIGQRGIVPENLPPAPDIKKLERHVKSQDKTIAASTATHLPPPKGGK